MIFRETVNSLTEMELNTILYMINEFGPKRGFPIDAHMLSFYKIGFIRHLLKRGKEKIKPEHKEFYRRLGDKFGVEL